MLKMEIKIIVVLLAVFLLGTFFFITFYSDYLVKHPKERPPRFIETIRGWLTQSQPWYPDYSNTNKSSSEMLEELN